MVLGAGNLAQNMKGSKMHIRSFDHTCGLPSNFGCVSPSLSEQVVAPIFGTETRYEQVGEEHLPDVIEVTPDQPQYRIGVVVLGKWIRPCHWYN